MGLLVGIGVMLLAAAAAAFFVLRTPTPTASAMPFEWAHLPPTTRSVSVGPLRTDLWVYEKLPRAYVLSALAERACGGEDVVGLLLRAKGGGYSRAKALGVDRLMNPSQFSGAYRCAKALADRLGEERAAVVRVSFPDGTEQRLIDMLRVSGGGVIQGRRQAQRGDVLWFGTKQAVAAFGRGYDPMRAQAEGTAELLARAASGIGATEVLDAWLKPSSIDLTFACVDAAPSGAVAEFLRLCLPDQYRKPQERMALRVQALAIGRDRSARSGSLRFDLALLAKDEQGATEIAADLRAFVSAWIASVNANEVGLAKLVAASSADPRDAARAAVFDAWVLAVKSTVVEHDGMVVHLHGAAKLRGDESATARDAMRARLPDAEALDAIVDAIAKGERPPRKELSKFVGADTVRWFLAQPVTKETCSAIVAHAKKLSSAKDFPIEQFGQLFALEQAWNPEQCGWRRLAEGERDCLLEAPSIAAMAECPQLQHPELSVMTKRLPGEWKRRDSSGDLVLEIASGKVAFTRRGARRTADLSIRPSGDDLWQIALPEKKGTAWHTFAFISEDQLKLGAVAGVLKRQRTSLELLQKRLTRDPDRGGERSKRSRK
ncbi:hypothetical protein JYT28_00890 [Desulfobulbus sp. AH-315-M07]|nr:hypothetical protein [Desulfobulbus sp. AH-315-M07]